ncbi:MAG: muconolactone Delta-isomerase family protein [Cytophagales bacterium]
MSNIIVNTQLEKVENIESVLQEEYLKVKDLQQKGVLKSLYIKEGNAGAVLIFESLSLKEVKATIRSLPLYPYFNKIEYSVVEQSF